MVGGLTASTTGVWASFVQEERVFSQARRASGRLCPRFVCFTAQQHSRRRQRVWSAVGVLAVGGGGVGGRSGCCGRLWRRQWAAQQNTQRSFRKHWQVYRGLVPADSAFSDSKRRESFLSLKSLLHPTVQRSKTIRRHRQEQDTVYI